MSPLLREIMTETKEHAKNMGLVGRQVKCFPPNNVCDRDDYLQTGSIALLQAIRKRNPSRGKLTTYAFRSIYRDIKRKQADKFSKKPARYHDLVVWDKEGLWEILPDNLTEQEKTCVELKLDGYSV